MDLDVVIQLQPENLDLAMEALDSLGYQPVAPVRALDFKDPEIRESWARDKNMIVFSLWRPGNPTFRLDVFVSEPFDFEATYQRAVRVDLGSTRAWVVALEDLIALKRTAGRPQDLADIQALERIQEKQRGGP